MCFALEPRPHAHSLKINIHNTQLLLIFMHAHSIIVLHAINTIGMDVHMVFTFT